MSTLNDPSSAKLHTTPLSSLPLDAWFLIADHLPPYELLYLSHTCKVLRAIVGRRLPEDTRNLTHSVNRWSFIAALANTSLDHFACIACYQLHPVDLEDNPTNHIEYPLWASRPRSEPYTYHYDDSATLFTSYAGKYMTKQKHVQLALKYDSRNRLGAHHRKHFEELMAPFHVRIRDPYFGPPGMFPHLATIPGALKPLIEYRATPKIVRQDVEGSSPVPKYIVHEEWHYKLSQLYKDTPAMDSEWTLLHFRNKVFDCSDSCNHQMRVDSTHALELHLMDLINKPPGQRTSFSCRKCPTDYEMWFEELVVGRGRREVLVIHTWKDMRTSRDDWKRRITENYGVGGGSFIQDFTPGDARYLYENDGRLPQRTCVDVDGVTPEEGLGSTWQTIWDALVMAFGGA